MAGWLDLIKNAPSRWREEYAPSTIGQDEDVAKTVEKKALEESMNFTPMGAGTLVKVGPGTGLAEGFSKLMHTTPVGERLAEVVDKPVITNLGHEALDMVSKAKPDEELKIPMGEIMDNPQVYEVMDWANQAAQKSHRIPSELSKLKDTMVSLRNSPEDVNLGSFMPIKDQIIINTAHLKSPEEVMGTLLHEGQHKVQQYQGTSQGASTGYFQNLQENIPKLREIYKDYPEFQDLLSKLGATHPNKGYMHSQGEANAYATELRQMLSQEERAKEPLYGRWIKLAEKYGWKLDPSKFIETPPLIELPTYQARMRAIQGFKRLIGGK